MEKMKRGGEGGLKMEGTMWKRRGDVSSSSWVFSAAHSAEDVQEEQSRAEQRPHAGLIKAAQLFQINYTSWTFTLTLGAPGPLESTWKSFLRNPVRKKKNQCLFSKRPKLLVLESYRVHIICDI